MALPTNGRVIIETTAGEIDIELWGKVKTISAQFETNKLIIFIGNTKNLQEFFDVGHGG